MAVPIGHDEVHNLALARKKIEAVMPVAGD
jgi:hypothetical protein